MIIHCTAFLNLCKGLVVLPAVRCKLFSATIRQIATGSTGDTVTVLLSNSLTIIVLFLSTKIFPHTVERLGTIRL